MNKARKQVKFGIVWLFIFMLFVSSCGKEEIEIIRVVDRQNMKMISLTGERTKFKNFYDADFVIVGGGLSGIAATIAACSSGRSTILIEETDSIASCFASPDTSEYFDNRFVETTGSSRRYIEFRNKIKKWYDSRSEKQPIRFQPYFLEFEDFGTDNFCFENEAAVDVIYEMIEQHIDRKRLIILNRHKVLKVTDFSERLASLDVVDLDKKEVNQVTGWMFIDASETGNLLSLCNIEYSTGRESRSETGEPHASETTLNLGTEDYFYIDPGADIRTDAYEVDLLNEKPSNSENAIKITMETDSKRMKAFTIISEQDISAEFHDGPRARFFVDSVGIGYALITIFEPGSEDEPVIVQTKPFQIPYSALISPKYSNFIAGGLTMGTTYVASTAYNSPSVQWMIGESAGEIAAFCAGYNLNTHELMNSGMDFRKFRNRLVIKIRIPIYWYDDVSVKDPFFAEAQLRPFYDPVFHKFMKTLHYPGYHRPPMRSPFPRNR